MQDWRILIGFLVVILIAMFTAPVEAVNATNTTSASAIANLSYSMEGIWWNASGGTTSGIFGGSAYIVTGGIVILIFAFLALRASISIDLLIAFFIPLIIVLAVAGFLPIEAAWMAVLAGGTIIGLALLKVIPR